MPPSPAMRYSPGREPRADNHKRGRSLESGILFRERDDDLALFNEVQSRERDNFLLQSNDDFEDTFTTKLRHFSDYKLGVNIPARGESNDLLNADEEKNDYEWLITPPDTPLFPSLDDEAPQVNLAQRGRPRTQPISISRSSTMEKSHRSSRGSASPNRLSPSPRSGNSTFQARGRSSSAPSSSPPATATRRPSPPSSKPLTLAPRVSTPTPRRLSTGSTGTTGTSHLRGVSPVKTSRGNSASPKVRAWQSNIPGFSTEAPPNLRTSLADRPASYVRGSSPASRNGRQSMSPTASRSISSSHSHDRDRFSSHSKGSLASSGEDDVESLPSHTVSSERSNSRRAGGFPNNKASFSKRPSRPVSSSSAPKRSFDLALRQMDHRKGPQNMFRPLLSSVPSSTFYAGKTSSAHRNVISMNSSVTTSSNASSDLGTSGAHDIEGSELNQDDATSGCAKVPDNVEDEIFVFEKADASNEDMRNEAHNGSPSGELGDLKGDLSRPVGFEHTGNRDTASSVVLDDFSSRSDFRDIVDPKDMLLCSRCGVRYSPFGPIEGDMELCADCIKSYSPLTISDPVTTIVVVGGSQTEASTTGKDHESFKAVEPQMTIFESVEVTCKGETRSAQLEDFVKDGQSTYGEPIWNFLSESSFSQPQSEECEPMQVGHQEVSLPSERYTDMGNEQIQVTSDCPNLKVDTLEGAGISILLKRSSSMKGPVVRSRNFSASSISYDDISYVRDSTNSMRSVGHGSVSASSSVDFGPARPADPRFQRQLSSRKSDQENYKYDMNGKHQRSGSSFSGTSSHAFHAPSLGTSTLDSFEVSIAHVGRDVTDTASEAHQDNAEENGKCTEIEDDGNFRTAIDSSLQLSAQSQTALDSGESSLTSSSKFKEPSFEKVMGIENDTSALQNCSDEDAIANPCVNSIDAADISLDAISEGESDHTCQSSPASQYDVSRSSIEEIPDTSGPTAHDKDIADSAEESNTSNHASIVQEESTVLVGGQGGIKGRSLTLEEATETILFCSSIVHNLAYEAATVAIEKENPGANLDNNSSWPLIPAVGKADSDKKELQSRYTSKRSSKSQKARQKKMVETENTKPPNGSSTEDKTDSPKTRLVGVSHNNIESMKPPKLESKCNCTIM